MDRRYEGDENEDYRGREREGQWGRRQASRERYCSGRHEDYEGNDAYGGQRGRWSEHTGGSSSRGGEDWQPREGTRAGYDMSSGDWSRGVEGDRESGSQRFGERSGQTSSSRFGSGYEGGLGSRYGQSSESYGGEYQGRGPGSQSRLTRYGRHASGYIPEGPHSGVGPRGYKRSSERLTEEVCDLLEEHGELDASNIDVKVEETTVTLSGTVDSRHAKRLAEDLAESVRGVRDVNNQLKVSDGFRDRGSESDSEAAIAKGMSRSGTGSMGGGGSKTL